MTWKTSGQKSAAVRELRQHGYRAQPLRRTYIEKRGKATLRPLGIPVMRDRAMQALYLLALNPIAETTGDETSYGFRPKRSTADAIQQCFMLLFSKGAAQWILEGDIESCFDKISHEWLQEHVPMEKDILHQWLKAGFIDKSVFFPTEDGTPQGGIASPVLANLALDGLLRRLREKFPKSATNSARHRVYLVRYADDFIITGDSKEVLEAEVRPLVEEFLEERGLTLSAEKTTIAHVDTGFDFLGKTVRKYRGTLRITPSKRSIGSVLERAREIIKGNSQAPAGELIQKLNPLLRGWAHHHRYGVNREAFHRVDHEIWKVLWSWARKRHPGRSRRWLKTHYFPAVGSRQWVFSGQVQRATSEQRMLRIFFASSVPMRRHIAIRRDANPFDPDWADYFKDRADRQRRENRHFARATRPFDPAECPQPLATVSPKRSPVSITRRT